MEIRKTQKIQKAVPFILPPRFMEGTLVTDGISISRTDSWYAATRQYGLLDLKGKPRKYNIPENSLRELNDREKLYVELGRTKLSDCVPKKRDVAIVKYIPENGTGLHFFQHGIDCDFTTTDIDRWIREERFVAYVDMEILREMET